MMILGTAAIALLASGGARPAAAADFRLCNHSRHHIVEFKTEAARDRNDYSSNWLRQPVAEGNCVPMRFAHNEHACHIRHLIRFGNGEMFKGEINICHVRTLEVHRDGHVSWE